MRALLASPRRRRRVLRWGIPLGVLVVVVAAVIAYGPTTEYRSQPFGEPSGNATPIAEPAEVRLSASTKREINDVVSRFVQTAVTRHDVDAAWSLVTPELRGGISRREWSTGDIPVYEYPTPMRHVELWNYELQSRREVIGNVILKPPPDVKDLGPIDFSIDVKAVGSGPKRQWRVNSFYPYQVYPSAAEVEKQARKARQPSRLPTAAERRAALKAQDEKGLNEFAVQIFLFGLIGLIVCVPLSVGAVQWARGRSTARRYDRERAR